MYWSPLFFRYVPSNYVKKEKKSLFDKIIPRKLLISNNQTYLKASNLDENNKINFINNLKFVSKAIVKHKYTANKYYYLIVYYYFKISL